MGGPLATALALATAPGAAAPPGPAEDLGMLTPAQLAGRRVVYAFSGAAPPPDLVRRIRRGEAGAVILFGDNVPSRAALRRLTARLQAVPRPPALDLPLLVMVDQEGGLVRRVAGPPARSAAAMGCAGARAGRAAGLAAGRLLRGLGVNVNLAPVADVGRPGSELGRTERAFGASPSRVARLAVAFSQGLRRGGVAATAKHFPGFGAARRSTDVQPVTIRLSASALRSVDARPFRALIAHDVPLVMLSTAAYPALGARGPAALARSIVRDELRGRLGFRGVTVTDVPDTPALAPVGGTGAVAVRAAAAGSDLLLHTGYAASARAAPGRSAGRWPPAASRARTPSGRSAGCWSCARAWRAAEPPARGSGAPGPQRAAPIAASARRRSSIVFTSSSAPGGACTPTAPSARGRPRAGSAPAASRASHATRARSRG